MERVPRFEIYQREDDDYGWRLRAANGQIIAVSGEGYSSYANALRAVGTVQRTVVMIADASLARATAAAAERAEDTD